MNTWPISIKTKDGWTFVGIPDRLGTGRLQQLDDNFPTLEGIVGDDWAAQLLRQLLPADRAWAWWTRTQIYKATGLPTNRAPDVVDPHTLGNVVVRSHLIEQTTLAFIPSHDEAAQELVTHWAASDTEQSPEHLWVAAHQAHWNTDTVASWCRSPDQWSAEESVTTQPIERVLVMFDEQIFCALRDAAGARAAADLDQLARRWGLSVIPGPIEYAWARPISQEK